MPTTLQVRTRKGVRVCRAYRTGLVGLAVAEQRHEPPSRRLGVIHVGTGTAIAQFADRGQVDSFLADPRVREIDWTMSAADLGERIGKDGGVIAALARSLGGS